VQLRHELELTMNIKKDEIIMTAETADDLQLMPTAMLMCALKALGRPLTFTRETGVEMATEYDLRVAVAVKDEEWSPLAFEVSLVPKGT
jgi:hypothetical protein